jgi:hypothetical protein
MSTSKRDVTTPVTTTWPNQHGSKQFHLDLAVDDLDAAAARCVEFGATLPVEQPRESWRVLLDPSGHPFCLTQAANWGQPLGPRAVRERLVVLPREVGDARRAG